MKDIAVNEQDLQHSNSEKQKHMHALMCALSEGRKSGEKEGWISSEDVRKHFRDRKRNFKNRSSGIR